MSQYIYTSIATENEFLPEVNQCTLSSQSVSRVRATYFFYYLVVFYIVTSE